MFIRKKKNKSGSVSIQIIQKINKKNKLVKTIGSSKDKKEVEFLLNKAYLEIPKIQKQKTLDIEYSKKDSDFLHSCLLARTPLASKYSIVQIL